MTNISIIIATYGDKSWERLAESAYRSAERQPRCQIIVRHETNGTLAGCRNRAAGTASNDWLCFLDADDELHEDFIKSMLPAIWEAEHCYQLSLIESYGRWDERAPMHLLAPSVSYVEADGARTTPVIPNRGRWPDLNECVIGTLVPADVFDVLGGFRELPIYEDWDLFLRCTKLGAEIVHVPEAIYIATQREGSRNGGALAAETYAKIWAEYTGAGCAA